MPQEYYGGNPNRNNNDKNLIPWWLIIAMFVVGMFPVGLILMFIRLGQENGGGQNRSQRNRSGSYSGQNAWNAQQHRTQRERAGVSEEERKRREQEAYRRAYGQAKKPTDKTIFEETEANPAAQSETKATAAGGASAPFSSSQPFDGSFHAGMPTRARMDKIRAGTVLSALGCVCMLIGGIATTRTLLMQLPFLGMEPMWFFQEAWWSMLTTGLGAGMFLFGHLRKGRSKKYRRYVNLIGDQPQVSIDALAKAYPAKRSAVISALEDMIDVGVFGDRAYLDYGRNMLILDGSSVGQDCKTTGKDAPADEQKQEHALLEEIRAVNRAIAHPEMSRKIDRIGEITESILEFQQEHPERADELRKFLNYYLPTTLKILHSYAGLEKQGGSGENVTATKQRIEGMMDMVVTGFERQLDKLFAGDMMDIAADITVMEQMMAGDGLFGQESFSKQANTKGSDQTQQGTH